MTKEKEKERLETCDNQPGEWVAMETKVVKGFKEKVINTVKCSREFQKDKDRPPPPPPPLDLTISKLWMPSIRAFWGSDGAKLE